MMHATTTRAVPEPSSMQSLYLPAVSEDSGGGALQKSKWEMDSRVFAMPAVMQQQPREGAILSARARKRLPEAEPSAIAKKLHQSMMSPSPASTQYASMALHPTTNHSPTTLRAVPPLPLTTHPHALSPSVPTPTSVIFGTSVPSPTLQRSEMGSIVPTDSPDVTRKLADLLSDQLQSMRSLVALAEQHTPLLAQQYGIRDALGSFSRFAAAVQQMAPPASITSSALSVNSASKNSTASSNSVITASPPGSASNVLALVGNGSTTDSGTLMQTQQPQPLSAVVPPSPTVIISPISSSSTSLVGTGAEINTLTGTGAPSNPPQQFESVNMADFALLDTLGTGMFSKVRLCRHKNSGQLYCLKIMSKEEIIKQKQQEHVRNEKWILSSASHPFIVRLYSTFQDHSNVYFLMEYVSGGELFSHIRRHVRLSNAVARFYAAEIILAVAYLHDMDVVHRDLKPENLLLDTHGHIKLIDFGFAKKLGRQRTYSMCGTPEYIAPEVILNKGHTKSADWWSLGVLIYEMLAGQPPFVEDQNHTVFERIIENSKTPYPVDFDPAARDLIEKLLVEDVEHRLGTRGAAEIKSHPWFRPVNWDHIYQRKLDGPIKPRSPNALLASDAETEENFAWDTL